MNILTEMIQNIHLELLESKSSKQELNSRKQLIDHFNIQPQLKNRRQPVQP
jgi:hypothetical protein